MMAMDNVGETGQNAVPGNESILSLGVELSGGRICLLENVSGAYRLAAWQVLPRRAEGSLVGLAADLCRQLGDRIGRLLWNDADLMPLVVSDEPVAVPPLAHVTVAASPRPHVRIWLAGLSPSQSIEAARDALGGSPAHVVGYTAFAADLATGVLADTLVAAAPDLVVIVGGFDDPQPATHTALVELCRVMGESLTRFAPAQRPTVVFAGNRWAAPLAVQAIQSAGGGTAETVANVHPAPGIVHKAALAQAVNFYYWRLCRRTPGFREISRWATSPGHITSLETSFAQLVQVWMELHRLPELHALYCAPAWWLHVWAGRNQFGLNMRYVEPNTRPPELRKWPPLQLVSGEWPESLWPRPELHWWDRSAMAPLVAVAGQVAPQAAIQVLRADLLRLGGR